MTLYDDFVYAVMDILESDKGEHLLPEATRKDAGRLITTAKRALPNFAAQNPPLELWKWRDLIAILRKVRRSCNRGTRRARTKRISPGLK